jgi:hypothetical protein
MQVVILGKPFRGMQQVNVHEAVLMADPSSLGYSCNLARLLPEHFSQEGRYNKSNEIKDKGSSIERMPHRQNLPSKPMMRLIYSC